MAFIIRFKLDADLANRKEAIEQEVPFIESLKPYEILIRQTQLKLSTIASFHTDSFDYPQILKKIADQTPLGIKIISINLKKDVGKILVTISAQAQTNSELSNFITGLKKIESFSQVTISSLGLEQNVIRSVINVEVTTQKGAAKSL